MLNIEAILRFLPHRYPFLLVDRVLEMEPSKHIVALKNVTYNEEFFQGHFPDVRIMPGVRSSAANPIAEPMPNSCLRPVRAPKA